MKSLSVSVFQGIHADGRLENGTWVFFGVRVRGGLRSTLSETRSGTIQSVHQLVSVQNHGKSCASWEENIMIWVPVNDI